MFRHPFFGDLDWTNMQNMAPPHVPQVGDLLHMSSSGESRSYVYFLVDQSAAILLSRSPPPISPRSLLSV
jgi:hypothetical protein